MYCTKCGFQLDDAFTFCPKCGRPARTESGDAKTPRQPLSRPIHQKMIAGVCAGFARSFDVDVALMRFVWIMAAIFSGGVVGLIYVGAWIAMPQDYPAAHRAGA